MNLTRLTVYESLNFYDVSNYFRNGLKINYALRKM